MTNAAWVASIEAAGVLTVDMARGHIAQAIQDGDAALLGSILAGTALSAAQISAREEMWAIFSIVSSADVANAAALVPGVARTQLINRGTNYYTVTGAP
jgi:hypothetical protein